MYNFSIGGNSDGEVDSDKEDGDETDKKENAEINEFEGKSDFVLLITKCFLGENDFFYFYFNRNYGF